MQQQAQESGSAGNLGNVSSRFILAQKPGKKVSLGPESKGCPVMLKTCRVHACQARHARCERRLRDRHTEMPLHVIPQLLMTKPCYQG